MASSKRKFWEESISSSLERLRDFHMWFPIPCLISCFLVLLLIGHVLLGLNPRLGNHANILPFTSKISDEGAIWIAASLHKESIMITTASRRVFRIPQKGDQNKKVQELTAYLKKQIENVLVTAAISRKVSHVQSILVIAVDQEMTMQHLRPILYAMAQAGISEYAFETKIPPKDQVQ